jgi:molecular chaperone DnaK (HSP70)
MVKDCTTPLIQYLLENTHMIFSVGGSAKNAFHSNSENTVFDAKRLIGRKLMFKTLLAT